MRKSGRAARHSAVLARAVFSGRRRNLVRQMVTFSRSLPARFDQPLPQMMAHLTPAAPLADALMPDTIRRLADAVAAWHLRSPLGICLRRSLLRYHFLRQAGLPVQIVFGARLKSGAEGGGVGGHAWLTLHGQPYHEDPADTRGFAELFVYPPAPSSIKTRQS